MQNLMQRWMGQFEKLLEERSGAALTVTPELTEPRPAALYVGTITLDGPLRGMLRISVPDQEMVQFVQLAGRRPLDAQVVLDETVLLEWKGLLEESATLLAAQLLADGDGEYKAILRELRAADAAVTPVVTDGTDGQDAANAETATSTASASDLASDTASDPSGSGMEASSYVLRAGEIALRVSIQTRMEAAQPVSDASQPLHEAQKGVSAADAPTAETGIPATEEASVPLPKAASTHPTADYAAQQLADALAAEKEMERAAVAAEARAAWRRNESNVEESSPFRSHPERLDLLLDIELEATLRFGALEMPLRKVLELGPGDVLQLDRHVQELVDLVVGDRIVARGEVVLVGGNFGLHVTEVAEPRRRLETIRCLF